MAETSKLSEARAALAVISARTSGLVASLPDTSMVIPGSAWTVREAAVHLTLIGFHYAEMAQGGLNQHLYLLPEDCAHHNDEFNADIPESDPGALAELMREGTDCLLAVSALCDDDASVALHGGGVLAMAHVIAAALAEHLLHGYDIAVAAHRPWPIDPSHAVMGSHGYRSSYPLRLNPVTTRAHTASYGVELISGDRFTVRFTDGQCRLEPPDTGRVDCAITADPVAFLLVESGRMCQWAAIALGLIRACGERPELAAGFTDLFLFP